MSERCKAIVWKIGPFVDGELPAVERDEVEAHLEGCKDCVEMAVQFRKLDAQASGEKLPSVTGEEWARIWEGILAGSKALREDKVIRVLLVSRVRKWMLPALAAAALFLAGIFVGSNLLERSSNTQELGKQRPAARSGKTEDFAEKRSGPPPVIEVEDDVTLIDLPNF